MRLHVEINYLDGIQYYERKLLAQIAEYAIRTADREDSLTNKDITMSVAFVASDEIQRVNRDFRQKDQVTDVISVGDYSDEKNISQEEQKNIFLGELVLCYTYIVQNAHDKNVAVDREFFVVFAHGILHLLGFSHGQKMYALQDSIAEHFLSQH